MTKSISPLTITNAQSKKRNFEVNKKCINSDQNLIKKNSKKIDRKNLKFIRPHNRSITVTKRRTIAQSKIDRISKTRNKSSLNRILRTYPSYIRVLWMIKSKNPV